MKFLLLFLFVAVALANQNFGTSEEIVARSMARVFRIDPVESLDCVHKTNVTLDDLRYMEDTIGLSVTETIDMKTVRRASCAIACCAQKIGVMVGGVLQVEELFKFFQKIGIPKDVEVEMRNTVRICKGEVTDTSDECMAGYKFMKCGYQRSQSIVQRK